MGEYEQGDEKILNSISSNTQNILNATGDIAARFMPKIPTLTKVEINSVKGDLTNAQKAISEGISQEKILDSIKKSPTAKNIQREGNNVDRYAEAIYRKAAINEAKKGLKKSQFSQQKTQKKTL